MHPLVGDLSHLKDNELEDKTNELTRRYFTTRNPEVQNQISMVLDSYKNELGNRRQREYEKMMGSRNKDLDKLIKVQ